MLDPLLKDNIDKVVERIAKDSVLGMCQGVNCHCVVQYLDFLQDICNVLKLDYSEHKSYFYERAGR